MRISKTRQDLYSLVEMITHRSADIFSVKKYLNVLKMIPEQTETSAASLCLSIRKEFN